MTQHFFSRTVGITRPANATPYTAGDVVGPSTDAGGAILTLSPGGGNGSLFKLEGSEMRVDLASVPAGMTSFRLHLYSATPPSALADNAAWTMPAGDAALYLGYVDLGTPVDIGDVLYVQTTGLSKTVRLGENATLFAYLVTAAGYTPASGTTMFIAANCIGG